MGRGGPDHEAAELLGRALGWIPEQARAEAARHDRLRMRADAGYFTAELAHAAVEHGCDFAIAAKRNTAMWRAYAAEQLAGNDDGVAEHTSGQHRVNRVRRWAALLAGNLSALLQALTRIDTGGRAHAPACATNCSASQPGSSATERIIYSRLALTGEIRTDLGGSAHAPRSPTSC